LGFLGSRVPRLINTKKGRGEKEEIGHVQETIEEEKRKDVYQPKATAESFGLVGTLKRL